MIDLEKEWVFIASLNTVLVTFAKLSRVLAWKVVFLQIQIPRYVYPEKSEPLILRILCRPPDKIDFVNCTENIFSILIMSHLSNSNILIMLPPWVN